MKRFFVLILFYLLSVQVSNAQVSQFVFITEPQTVPAGEMSSTITVQAQNNAGVSEDIIETHDMVFTSTSPTGEFFSTSGNPVSTTMSKNTANKNFLYKDPTAGTHTITVTVTGRTSLQSFSATQQIVVGGSSQVSGNINNSTTTQSSESIEEEVRSVPINMSSAHSSPSPISSTENKIDFSVSAGRERLTTVGNKVLFEAMVTKTQNISEKMITFEWSFGDGTKASGKNVSHFYRNAGDYTVVLNASASDKQAVSRTSVRVISPNIIVKKIDGGIEVSNKSGAEINLGDWTILGNKSFTIPSDTLIPNNKTVVFSDEITGINTLGIKFSNPQGRVLADSLGESKAMTSITNTDNLSDIQAKIDEVKINLAKIVQKKSNGTNPPSVANNTKATPPKASYQNTIIEPESQTANVIEIFSAPKSKSLVSGVFAWPTRGFNFIKRFFVEE